MSDKKPVGFKIVLARIIVAYVENDFVAMDALKAVNHNYSWGVQQMKKLFRNNKRQLYIRKDGKTEITEEGKHIYELSKELVKKFDELDQYIKDGYIK